MWDPYSGLSMIILVLFSVCFSIMYWRVWLPVVQCLKAHFPRERMWGAIKALGRYVCQIPRRTYYACCRRLGISDCFAEVFPDGTDLNFEDVENQVIHDHNAEVLSGCHGCNEPPIELVPLPGPGHRSTTSVYSSHPEPQQAEVYSPAPSANSREIMEDILSSRVDKLWHDTWVANWVITTSDYLAAHWEEMTATIPAI